MACENTACNATTKCDIEDKSFTNTDKSNVSTFQHSYFRFGGQGFQSNHTNRLIVKNNKNTQRAETSKAAHTPILH